MTPAALADRAHDALAEASSLCRELARAVAESPTPQLEHALACATRAETRLDDTKRALLDAAANMGER